MIMPPLGLGDFQRLALRQTEWTEREGDSSLGTRVFAAIVTALSIGSVEAEVRFNRDVRPIMSDTCFRCHGPDKNARMAGLRLDIREEALKITKSGVIPIVPGEPERSAIVRRIFATDARIMPPAHAHKELMPGQKETIRQWIA